MLVAVVGSLSEGVLRRVEPQPADLAPVQVDVGPGRVLLCAGVERQPEARPEVGPALVDAHVDPGGAHVVQRVHHHDLIARLPAGGDRPLTQLDGLFVAIRDHPEL